MEIPLLALLFQGIPESIGIALLAYVIAGVPLKKGRIVVLGLIYAFSAYFIRLIPATFGVHSIFLLGIMFIYLIKVEACSVLTALKAGLVSQVVLIVIETIFLSINMSLTGLPPEELLNNIILRIITGLPQATAMYLVAYIVYRFKKHRSSYSIISDLWNDGNEP